MPSFLQLILLAAAILVVIYAIWRYWTSMADMTPEEKEYDERVAELNERQANRLTDEQLTHPPSDDDAWQIMLRRGRNALRRSRYHGDLQKRTSERRGRK